MRWQGEDRQDRRFDYVPSHDAAMRAFPREVRDKPWLRWAVAAVVVPTMLAAIVAAFLYYTRVSIDEICNLRTDGAGQRPAHCPPLPIAKDGEQTRKEVRAARDSIEARLEDLAKAAKGPVRLPARPPLEVFSVTPAAFWNDMTVTVKKAESDIGGQFELFACYRKKGPIKMIGSDSYSAAFGQWTYSDAFAEPDVVLLLTLEPTGGEPVTLLYPWEWRKPRLFKDPVIRKGLLTCNQIAGQF